MNKKLSLATLALIGNVKAASCPYGHGSNALTQMGSKSTVKALADSKVHTTSTVTSESRNDSGYDYSSELFAVSEKTCVSTTVSTFDKTNYQEVVRSIIDIYEAIDDTVSANSNPRAEFAGCVLRMAGHDFMDYRTDTGLGGSDGCINFNDEDNTGIPSCVAAHGLVAAYAEFCESVSLADWMVIAGEAIMGRTATDFSNTATDVYYADGQLAGDF
jgi:hypothetical protein